jgi:UDP-N-acetylglucosamine--N-acetylmuramyl-(pentapeptide) pyrophosphoryl-undecaprenol N-acetylglucosamine transferase
MTIVVTGGGSGGHITPILAVARELKQLQPDVRIVYIGQKGDKLLDIPKNDPSIDEVFSVQAGKFRRYHGEGWKQIFAVPTQLMNLRDGLKVLVGIGQSYRLIKKLRPSIIFTRGAFVSVPVAIGGRFNHVPYVTHDSDSIPSLANRLIAGKARLHAVALPANVYPYPPAKTVTVGIPLSQEYQLVTSELQQQYRQELKLSPTAKILFATGGGNGAETMNEALIVAAPELLRRYPELIIIHVAGRKHQEAVSKSYSLAVEDVNQRQRVLVRGFITDLYRNSGAADIVVTRAGATNLAEFAVQGKPCIVMPAAQLVGGHQLKNAQVLADAGAVVLLTDQEAVTDNGLARVVSQLFDDSARRQTLSNNFAGFARGDAAHTLAVLLLDEVKNTKTNEVTP